MEGYDPYDFITKLRIKRFDKGWYDLEWRWLWGEVLHVRLSEVGTRTRWYRSDWDNGCFRSWKQFHVDIKIPMTRWAIVSFVRWGFSVGEKGPLDWDRRMKINKEGTHLEWD